MTWAGVFEFVVAVLVVLGAAFTLLGSIGLLRLPDFHSRLHGPSKATTLGIGGLLLAAALAACLRGETPSWRELLISLFIALTTPVAAYLLAQAGRHRELPGSTGVGANSGSVADETDAG